MWKQKFRQPSFRGVPFNVRESDFPVGRRTVLHQFVQRDDPYVEDLGRLPRRFTLQGFVNGRDYMDRRDALIAALETPGPGLLVHPYYGEMLVYLDAPAPCREGLGPGGGVAEFAMSFVAVPDAGTASPVAVAAAPELAAAQAEVAEEAAANTLNVALQVAGQSAYVVEQAVTAAQAVITRVAAIAQGDVLTAVTTAGSLLGLDQSSILAILSSGRAGQQLLAVFKGYVAGSSSSSRVKGKNLAQIARQTPAPKTGSGGEQSRTATDNENALNAFEREAVTGLVVEEYATAQPESTQDSAEMRDDVIELIDAVLELDTSDTVCSEFVDLRAIAIAAITQNGAASPDLAAVTTQKTLPAMFICHRHAPGFFPGGTMESQLDDFVRRNRVVHPGFVSAGEYELLKEQNRAS
ncbi:DNA circularization N-terminal domain-containing protein [Desulfovibrio sp. OttesenSCG-928-C06]|nr:DNA circularization N-terminal domain-containing protein [Desulfovibrio sp. OttesenSCG-928-C06]